MHGNKTSGRGDWKQGHGKPIAQDMSTGHKCFKVICMALCGRNKKEMRKLGHTIGRPTLADRLFNEGTRGFEREDIAALRKLVPHIDDIMLGHVDLFGNAVLDNMPLVPLFFTSKGDLKVLENLKRLLRKYPGGKSEAEVLHKLVSDTAPTTDVADDIMQGTARIGVLALHDLLDGMTKAGVTTPTIYQLLEIVPPASAAVLLRPAPIGTPKKGDLIGHGDSPATPTPDTAQAAPAKPATTPHTSAKTAQEKPMGRRDNVEITPETAENEAVKETVGYAHGKPARVSNRLLDLMIEQNKEPGELGAYLHAYAPKAVSHDGLGHDILDMKVTWQPSIVRGIAAFLNTSAVNLLGALKGSDDATLEGKLLAGAAPAPVAETEDATTEPDSHDVADTAEAATPADTDTTDADADVVQDLQPEASDAADEVTTDVVTDDAAADAETETTTQDDAATDMVTADTAPVEEPVKTETEQTAATPDALDQLVVEAARDRKAFGDKLKVIIDDSDVSQADLNRALQGNPDCDITGKAGIYNLIAGRLPWSKPRMRTVLKRLKVEAETLLDDVGGKSPAIDATSAEAKPPVETPAAQPDAKSVEEPAAAGTVTAFDQVVAFAEVKDNRRVFGEVISSLLPNGTSNGDLANHLIAKAGVTNGYKWTWRINLPWDTRRVREALRFLKRTPEEVLARLTSTPGGLPAASTEAPKAPELDTATVTDEVKVSHEADAPVEEPAAESPAPEEPVADATDTTTETIAEAEHAEATVEEPVTTDQESGVNAETLPDAPTGEGEETAASAASDTPVADAQELVDEADEAPTEASAEEPAAAATDTGKDDRPMPSVHIHLTEVKIPTTVEDSLAHTVSLLMKDVMAMEDTKAKRKLLLKIQKLLIKEL